MELKKAKRLYGVHTYNGFVHVRSQPDTKSTPIRHIDQLANFVDEIPVANMANKRKLNNSGDSQLLNLNEPKSAKTSSHLIRQSSEVAVSSYAASNETSAEFNFKSFDECSPFLWPSAKSI